MIFFEDEPSSPKAPFSQLPSETCHASSQVDIEWKPLKLSGVTTPGGGSGVSPFSRADSHPLLLCRTREARGLSVLLSFPLSVSLSVL